MHGGGPEADRRCGITRAPEVEKCLRYRFGSEEGQITRVSELNRTVLLGHLIALFSRVTHNDM
jgi:hypothetical protein